MAKFETICSALTWGLMNALFLAVAFGAALPDQAPQGTHGVVIASVASASKA